MHARGGCRPDYTIRPYEPSDHAAVRNLVVDINRELAPAAMRDAFEDYISRSLRGEIDRIPEYYGARGGRFFVAVEANTLVGVSDSRGWIPMPLSCGGCTCDVISVEAGSPRKCSVTRKRSVANPVAVA